MSKKESKSLTIQDLGGTMPEELPTPQTSTKTLEKQHKKQISSGRRG